MSRVKRGVAATQNIKKFSKLLKVFTEEKKIQLELLSNHYKNLYNILIEIAELKKEILDHFGYKELMLVLESKV